MNRQFIILIIIILTILFLYKTQENITSESGKTLSDEALQNIASVYNTQNMIVTNLNATNQAIFKDTKMSGNLNVSGTITGNVVGNLTGNVVGNVVGNVTGNINSPNSQYILKMEDGKNGDNLVIYDNSGNVYKKMKQWVYKGCYRDNRKRVLSDYPGDLGVSNCQKYAEFNKYKYMASQYGGQCFAGNNDPTVLGAGDANQCNNYDGGAWTNQVWEYK